MKKLVWSILAVAGAATAVHAEPLPQPWCVSVSEMQNTPGQLPNKFPWNNDAEDLADSFALEGVITASCTTDYKTAERYHTELAAARARWAKRLHMTEADWADAAQWMREPQGSRHGRELRPVDHAAYSELGPMAQFALFTYGLPSVGKNIYTADVLGSHLTETGRLGYVSRCLQSDKPAAWALCLGDFDALDLDKMSAELRADKQFTAAERMYVRLVAWKLVHEIVPDVRAKLDKEDPVYKQLNDVAAKGRKSWSASPELLALVDALEDAHVKQSRSLHVDRCAEKSRSALTAQVTALPAALFADMPMDPDKAAKPDRRKRNASRPVHNTPEGKLLAAITSTPDGYLAAVAVVLCAADGDNTELAHALVRALGGTSGLRGPHTAALAAMVESGLQPDARGSEIEYPKAGLDVNLEEVSDKIWSKGVIAKVARKGDVIHIEFSGKNMTGTICTGTRTTNRVRSINDGKVQYEQECDSHETTHYNNAPKPIDVPIADGAALKPGMAILYSDGIMMAWPKPDAAKPVVALGVAIKK